VYRPAKLLRHSRTQQRRHSPSGDAAALGAPLTSYTPGAPAPQLVIDNDPTLDQPRATGELQIRHKTCGNH
jgi:hypothetical protein